MSDTVFVIFGISSDLSMVKLLPAIYHLVKNKGVSDFSIVGLASSDYTVDYLVDNFKKRMKNPDLKVINKIKERLVYQKGDFNDPSTYIELMNNINQSGNKNILYYLATLPEYFKSITCNLKKQGLTKEKNNWVRIVFEKPFGTDLKSAIDLNNCVTSAFSESQVYRIDHYLAKELVQNISVLRFMNSTFEPLWNNEFIDNVQIILDENLGIGRRAKFYDKSGVVKDIIQNHALQLLSLVAMERPKDLTPENIRDAKYKLLSSIKPINKSDICLSQYKGYKNEKGVSPDSTTPTYVATRLFIDNDQWAGVPFYIRAGKKQKNKQIMIYVEFKKNYLNNGVFENLNPNYLVISVQPCEGVYMVLNIKEPGRAEVSPVKMEFVHAGAFDVNTPEAYETLFECILEGDHSVFVRSDEIEQSWKLIDPIIDKVVNPEIYEEGTLPNCVKNLIESDNRKWFVRKSCNTK